MSSQKRALTIILLLSVFISVGGFCSTPPILESGLNAFQQGKFDQARQSFSDLSSDPRWKFAALYNLGNTAVRQNHLGEALGYYLRALNINPLDRDTRENISFVLNALGGKRLIAPPTNFDVFREQVLGRFTFSHFLLGTFLSSVGFLWSLLAFLKRRPSAPTQDSLDEEPRKLPLGLSLASFILVVFISLSALKLVDTYSGRGIVITDKAPLRSGPGEGNASLLDIPEGSEVVIQDSEKDWLQVTPIGGNGLTGWINKTALMATSGGGPF